MRGKGGGLAIAAGKRAPPADETPLMLQMRMVLDLLPLGLVVAVLLQLSSARDPCYLTNTRKWAMNGSDAPLLIDCPLWDFTQMNLSTTDIKKIADSLQSSGAAVTELDLSDNSIGVEGLMALTPAANKLETLVLDNVKMPAEEADDVLAMMLTKSPKLKSFSVNQNWLGIPCPPPFLE